jgi:hypothetical protein
VYSISQICLLLTALCLLTSCGGPGERIKDIEAQKTPTPTATPTEREISGVFNVSGTAANDTEPYNGVLTVAPSGDVYNFRWALNKGTRVGTGVQMGSAVGVSFAPTGGGKGCGVGLYKVNTINGTLEGRQVRWGNKNYSTETATREDGKSFPGRYKYILGANEGQGFTGTLTIKKDGDGYDFEWHQDENLNTTAKMVGFSIWKGSYAAVSFGGRQCSFALYDITSNGSLDGNWGGQKAVTFGTETAKRQ